MISVSKTINQGAPVHEVFERLDAPAAEARARARELARFILDYRAPNAEVTEGAYKPLVKEPMLRVRGDGRLIMAELQRELADRIERGDIDGSNCGWIDTHGASPEHVSDETAAEGAIISGLQFCVREPNAVRLRACEIIEETRNPIALVGLTPAHLINRRDIALVEG